MKSLLRGKYCLIHLEIVKRPKNNKQDNVEPPQPQHNFILFELDFNVKFPLLRLLLFLSDLKVL